MTTLDTTANLTANLSVKFHSARGMKQEERDTIKKCLKKANEAVAMTVDVIAGTKSSSKKVQLSSLTSEYHLQWRQRWQPSPQILMLFGLG